MVTAGSELPSSRFPQALVLETVGLFLSCLIRAAVTFNPGVVALSDATTFLIKLKKLRCRQQKTRLVYWPRTAQPESTDRLAQELHTRRFYIDSHLKLHSIVIVQVMGESDEMEFHIYLELLGFYFYVYF